MRITIFFEKVLGASLRNPQTSWGSVRKDGYVFLRVWQDEVAPYDGTLCVRLTNSRKAEAYRNEHGQYKPGFPERKAHVGLVLGGAKCLLIMCEAKNKDVSPRQIKAFDEEGLFPVGKLVDRNGDFWAELRSPVPADSI